MEEILFKLGIFTVGPISLYLLVVAKTFFRRLALLATVCGGVVVYVLLSSSEKWPDTSLFLKFSEWLGFTGVIAFAFLIASIVLDWLFDGD